MANKYVTILDNTGRNILGTVGQETATDIEIVNPVMISVQPQNQQFQVQLIPLFLAEFISPNKDGSRAFNYTYNKANIAIGTNFEIDPRITSQYEKMIEATTKMKPANTSSPEVIKLFDE